MPPKRPCLVCRQPSRFGRVCDNCREEHHAIPRAIPRVPTLVPSVSDDLINAGPFIEWLDQRLAVDDALTAVAERANVGESWLRQGAFRRTGEIDRATMERVLEAHDTFPWEVYDDDLPEPEAEPERPTTDSRGRDCTKPRGVPCRLTDAQLASAYRLHAEGGMSIRELGRRGWKVWGYSSEKVAAVSISTGFRRLGLQSRDRVEATVAASTIHGKAPRGASGPEYSEHRKAVRRASGEVRGVLCKGVKTQYPGKGLPCAHSALAGGDYCWAHDPERAVERDARMAEIREKAA